MHEKTKLLLRLVDGNHSKGKGRASPGVARELNGAAANVVVDVRSEMQSFETA